MPTPFPTSAEEICYGRSGTIDIQSILYCLRPQMTCEMSLGQRGFPYKIIE